jgi:hypothetical protein
VSEISSSPALDHGTNGIAGVVSESCEIFGAAALINFRNSPGIL